MNERIKQLAEQAGMYIVDDEFSTYGKFAEKFAELIVRECVEACSRANEIRHFVPPTQQQVVLSCMDEIERTFGIKK